MSKGKNINERIGIQGMITSTSDPDYSFLYENSLVKDAKYNLGDIVDLPDGRQFRYAKSTGAAAFYASHGVAFGQTGYTAITTFATTHAVGAKQVTIPAATHATLTEDQLRGGYVILFDGASDYYTTVRQIIGNDAAAANVAFVVYLDAPLTYAITASTSKCETFENPWGGMVLGSDAALPKAGIPAAYVSAAAKYFWVQTKGICFVAPQSTVNNNEGVGIAWRHDGSIEGLATALGATVPDADGTQYAGYRIVGSQAGNGPLVVLNG